MCQTFFVFSPVFVCYISVILLWFHATDLADGIAVNFSAPTKHFIILYSLNCADEQV